jgi:prepilin-type N-terminal cleavage/methylation domain-containing protein
MIQPSTPFRRSTGRGFSLVELMVVISVILVLLGLGVAVGTAIIGEGDKVATLSAMRKLTHINDAYEIQFRTLVELDAQQEWESGGKDVPTNPWYFRDSQWYIWMSIEYFVSKTSDNAKVREQYDSAGTQETSFLQDLSSEAAGPWDENMNLTDYQGTSSAIGLFTHNNSAGNGKKEVADIWRKPLVYKSTHEINGSAGGPKAWNSRDDIDYVRNDFIPALSNGAYFASAGPDKLFGNIQALGGTAADIQSKAAKATKDNIYSWQSIGADEE